MTRAITPTRSPYLIEATLEAALRAYPNPEKISERNAELMRELGLAVMKGLLTKCYEE